MQKKSSYRDSSTWKQSIDLASQCYRLASTYPPSEEHRLTARLINVSLSIPVCIADGLTSSTQKDAQLFIDKVRLSLLELETLLVLSNKFRLAPTSAIKDVATLLSELRKKFDRMNEKITATSKPAPVRKKRPPAQQRVRQAQAA